jgi:VWFA-related protein
LLRRPTQDFDSLHQAINRRVTGGAADLYDALYAGLKLVETRPGRPLVVLFTDGAENASWLTAKELRDVARTTEAMVHIVGIRSKAGVYTSGTYDPTSMTNTVDLARITGQRVVESAGLEVQFPSDIAKATGGRVWIAQSSAELTDVYLKVIGDIESRYLLSYQPRGVPKEAWHSLEVKLRKGKKGTIRARPGYMATTDR